jgi:tight adherence protein B
MDSLWWWLGAGGLAAAWITWLIQKALYDAIANHRMVYTSQFEHRLRDLFLFVDLRLLWPAAFMLGVFICIVCVGAGLGFIAGAIAMLVCWALPSLVVIRVKRQRMRSFEAQLPDALLSISSSMRAGASLSNALSAIVAHALPPLSQEFAVVSRQVRLGASPADAFQQLCTRLGGQTLELLALTLRVAIQTGGPLAAMLEQTAKTMQDNQQIKSKLSAMTAQGWLQAWVMAGMPLALMGVLGFMDPNFFDALLYSSSGHAVLASLAFLEVLGFWWLSKTVVIRV